MKLIKYITGSLLILIVFIFIGELYVWNLDSFEENYAYVTFYLQKNTTKAEMTCDICTAAEKNNIDVFVVESTVTSLFSNNINIYISNQRVKKYLDVKSGIKSGKFRSIFLGTLNVKFFDWGNIPDISKFEKYFVIGNENDIVNFKKNLVDKYAGRFPQDGYSPINSKLSVIASWICVFIFLLLLTLYEVLQQKKNILLNIIMGEQVEWIIFQNVFCDIAVYFIIYTILMRILSLYTNVFYLREVSFIFFGLFLLINSMVYLMWLFVDYKKDIQSRDNARSVLKVTYAYKVLMSVLLIFIMSGCVELIFEGLNYYRQKDFFEGKKDYYYITVEGSVDNARQMQNIYYTQAKKENKEMGVVDLGKWLTDVEYIYVDRATLDYICSCIPDIQDKIFDNKVNYLVPCEFLVEDISEDMKDICFAYLGKEYPYEIIEYDQTAWIMAISNTGQINSTLKRNPIIILNNLKDFEMPLESVLYIGNSSMYCFSEKEFENIATEKSFHDLHYRTNAYENYIYYWIVMKRSMILGCVLLVILLILEGLILGNILRYEYQISAKELMLNKIQGNNFCYRHKKLIAVLMSGWLSLFVSTLICFILGFTAIIYVVAGGILILVAEYFFAVVYSYKLDNANINRIFKGDIL